MANKFYQYKHLSPHTIEHKKDHAICLWKSRSWFNLFNRPYRYRTI